MLLPFFFFLLLSEEFIQSVQSTAGMAVVLLVRSVMGCGDEVASVVSKEFRVQDFAHHHVFIKTVFTSFPDWLLVKILEKPKIYYTQ